MSTSNNILYTKLMKRNVQTSAKVVRTPLVAGGEPQQAELISGCNPPLICGATTSFIPCK